MLCDILWRDIFSFPIVNGNPMPIRSKRQTLQTQKHCANTKPQSNRCNWHQFNLFSVLDHHCKFTGSTPFPVYKLQKMHFWSRLIVHEFLPPQQNKLKPTPQGMNICILCRKYNIFDIHNAMRSYFEFASNIGLHFIIKNHKLINEIKNIGVKRNNLCLK